MKKGHLGVTDKRNALQIRMIHIFGPFCLSPPLVAGFRLLCVGIIANLPRPAVHSPLHASPSVAFNDVFRLPYLIRTCRVFALRRAARPKSPLFFGSNGSVQGQQKCALRAMLLEPSTSKGQPLPLFNNLLRQKPKKWLSSPNNGRSGTTKLIRIA